MHLNPSSWPRPLRHPASPLLPRNAFLLLSNLLATPADEGGAEGEEGEAEGAAAEDGPTAAELAAFLVQRRAVVLLGDALLRHLEDEAVATQAPPPVCKTEAL